MLKKFISYYSNHKKLFTLDLLCAFALALCDLVYPMITREIINDVVPNNTVNIANITHLCYHLLFLFYFY